MSRRNRIILKQMVRLSTILADLRSAKRSINRVQEQAAYFIVQGESSNFLEVRLKAAEADCLCLGQYLRLSVSNCCSKLDGFDPSRMDPLGYISSSDIKNRCATICRGTKEVAIINLVTGEIQQIEPDLQTMTEDKCPAEKS